MTSHEKRLLGIGVLVGALAAAAGAYVWSIRTGRTQTVETSSSPKINEPGSADAAPATSGSPVAAQLSPQEQAKIGLQTSEVRRESLSEDILAIGRVEEPETAIATVSTRLGGRIEKLFVNYTGQPVREGDPVATIQTTNQPAGKDEPIASIYTRDVIAAAEEYKFALQNRERAHGLARPDAIEQADALVDASRVRLERFGLSSDQIDKLLTSPEQPIRVTVSSTSSGILRSRKVTEGQFVNPGDTLIELTDLKSVWIKADVFDADLAKIRPGLPGTITSEAIPGLRLAGKVDFIDPHSDPQTRTTPVRIQVGNPDTRLRPGMIVQTTFHLAPGSVLTVPRDAVLDSGTEKVVYIARDSGIFEQRRVQLGSPVKDRYPVTAGLMAGDKVVTKGVFLVDSQTRLTGGLTGMFGGSKSFTESTQTQTSTAKFKLTLRTEPDPPQGAKENTLHVTLLDAAGKAIPDAQVRLTFVMPAMPAMNMAEMRNSAELKWTGSEYVGPITIMMAGGWNVSVEARRGGELLATSQLHVNAR
jgi:Cu(I)/Ag(I) efflux system membrane fusion protein